MQRAARDRPEGSRHTCELLPSADHTAPRTRSEETGQGPRRAARQSQEGINMHRETVGELVDCWSNSPCCGLRSA